MAARGFPQSHFLRHRLDRTVRQLAALADLGRARLFTCRQVVATAGKDGLDDAVDQQVGIAPDWTREVRVGVIRQAEVARVVHRVDGLLHRTQQQRVDLRRVGPAVHGLGDGLYLRGLRVVAQGHAHAQGTQHGLQRHALLRRGAFVHAEEARMFGVSNVLGRADVGRQHRLFDQPVRIGPHTRHDLLDAATVVADDLRLSGLEVHRTAFGALLEQGAVHLVQVQQVRQDVGTSAGLGATRVGQHGRHFGVREAGVRIDDRRVELVGVDAAVGGHEHVADHRQALDIGVQRTQAVGKLLGQHRNDAAREVHRGGAVVGVFVQRLAGLDVVADVGNGHDQTPAFECRLAAAAFEGLAVHRVVEVARVFAVDGDEGHVGKIDTVLAVGGAQLVGQRCGLRQRLGRELVRHFVLAHRDLDLHARVVDLAQHLGHAAHGLRMQRWRFGQFHRHDLPHGGAGGGVLGDQDVLTITAVFRGHEPLPTFMKQAADDRRLAPLKDVEHAAFGPAFAVVAQHANAHAVFVQDAAHLLRCEVDGGVAVVGNDQAVAVAVAFNAAFEFAHQGGAGVAGIGDVVFDDGKVQGS